MSGLVFSPSHSLLSRLENEVLGTEYGLKRQSAVLGRMMRMTQGMNMGEETIF